MTIEENFWTELAQIQTKTINYIPLDEDAYLHLGFDEPVIEGSHIAKLLGSYVQPLQPCIKKAIYLAYPTI